jgi:hypothetical protein
VEHILLREQVVPGAPGQVFEFYADAANLERITPDWLGFAIVTPQPIGMRPGALIEYRLKLHHIPLRWLTRIEAWEPGKRFVDVQVPTVCGTTLTPSRPTRRARVCATKCATPSRSVRWESWPTAWWSAGISSASSTSAMLQ